MAEEEIILRNWNKSMLELAAIRLIPIIIKGKHLLHVKQTAFEYFDKNSSEILQIQITVTRDTSSFLEDLETEEL